MGMRVATLLTVVLPVGTYELYGWEADAREDLDEDGLPAFRERRIKVQNISPTFGRYEGGLLVNITGKGFVIATDPKCMFGGEDSMAVNATVKSQNFIQCWTPPHDHRWGGIPFERQYDVYPRVVEVSLNGVDYTRSGKPFTYYEHSKLMVSLFEPQGGPVAGGTEITVHGSMFQESPHLKCKFTRKVHQDCGSGHHVHSQTCHLDPVVVVDATFLTYWSLKCISPPGFPESIGGTQHGVPGLPALPVDALGDINTAPTVTHLEVALDDFHFSSHQAEWHFFDEGKLVISAVDPIGGPTAGGTLIEVLGSGFAELGGSMMHGSTMFSNITYDPLRRIDAGTFCKFSLTSDSNMLVDFACKDALCIEGTEDYGGIMDGKSLPLEGETALSDAADNMHLANYSSFTVSSTPSLGRWSSVVRATYVSPYKMLCESPPYHGTLTDNKVTLDMRVVLNGDFHDLNALSKNVTYELYDPREARVNGMDRTGGPLSGNTSVTITGKLFSDYTLQTLQQREHVLRCRFGWVGETLATLVDERTVKCFSPEHNVDPNVTWVLGSGHADDVPVDLTLNGQDYMTGRNLRFIYSPRDRYQKSSPCTNEWGQLIGGMCNYTFTGIAVAWLQPMGGPKDGGTSVVVTGQHFARRGPRIECAFGGMSRVNATLINDTAVLCVSPPAPQVAGGFEDYFLDITLNGETNFLTASQVPFVYYNHTATLSVASIYPQAGGKRGGNMITITGTGFRVLGGINTKHCMSESENVTAAMSPREHGGERLSNESIQGSRICFAPPEDEATNRGLQCIFGDMAPVKAFQVLSHEQSRVPHAVVSQITCEVPPLPQEELEKAGLTPDDIMPVCVEVTLNGNRSQATTNCVTFTYYDF